MKARTPGRALDTRALAAIQVSNCLQASNRGKEQPVSQLPSEPDQALRQARAPQAAGAEAVLVVDVAQQRRLPEHRRRIVHLSGSTAAA